MSRMARPRRPHKENRIRTPLRRAFLWTVSANAFYAVSQWATLSIIAKLGSPKMLGEYALAISIAAPLSMLSHLNLRVLLATDVERRHTVGDYVAVRLITTLITIVAISLLALTVPHLWLATTLAACLYGAENISDLYYGTLQRREELDRIARSLVARGLLSVAALAVALWAAQGLSACFAALVAVRVLVLLMYDRPRGSVGEDMARSSSWEGGKILRTALPLGLVLMLISLNSNLPRYAVEHYLGASELAAFTAAASFINVGGIAINALGQTATSRLAGYYVAGELTKFRRLATRMAALPVVLGGAGIAMAVAFGKVVLSYLYRPEFAAYQGLLIAMMAAAVFIYTGSALGYLVTSLRVFAPQMYLFSVAALTCGLASWVLIPRIGLVGGAIALALGACVQITGNAVVLMRALAQRQEGP